MSIHGFFELYIFITTAYPWEVGCGALGLVNQPTKELVHYNNILHNPSKLGTRNMPVSLTIYKVVYFLLTWKIGM